MREIKKIAIIIVGGTFCSSGPDPRQPTNYSLTDSNIVENLKSITKPPKNVDIEWSSFSLEDSINTKLLDRCRLSERIGTFTARVDVYGVVVINGSDTQEESCFVVDCTSWTEKAIVFTSSIRPLTSLSWDGPMNLLSSICLARHAKARNRGTLVVSAERFFHAWHVVKTKSNQIAAFDAPVAGPLGTFVNAEPQFTTTQARPFGHCYLDLSQFRFHEKMPSVPIISALYDDAVRYFESAIELGAEAVVLSVVASGSLSTELKNAVEGVSKGFPVIMSTEAAGFCQPRDVKDAIGSGYLTPRKAAALVTLCLISGKTIAHIRNIFEGQDAAGF